MYDKYSQATQVTAGVTQLGTHKGLLVVPTTGTPGLTAWAFNSSGGTFNLGLNFAAATAAGPQIFPMNVYAVTAISGANVYTLN